MSITRANIVYPPSKDWGIPDNGNPKLYRPNIAKYGNEHTIEGREGKLYYAPEQLQEPLKKEKQQEYKAQITTNKQGKPMLTHNGKPLNDFNLVAIIKDDDTLYIAPRENEQEQRMIHQILAMGEPVKYAFSVHLDEGRIKSKYNLMNESGHYKPNEGLTYLLFDKMKNFLDDTIPSNLERQKEIVQNVAKEKSKKYDTDYTYLVTTPPLSPVSSLNDWASLRL
jgi:hypothetical protein